MTEEEIRKAYGRMADALILMAREIEDPPRKKERVVTAELVFLPTWKPKGKVK